MLPAVLLLLASLHLSLTTIGIDNWQLGGFFSGIAVGNGGDGKRKWTASGTTSGEKNTWYGQQQRQEHTTAVVN